MRSYHCLLAPLCVGFRTLGDTSSFPPFFDTNSPVERPSLAGAARTQGARMAQLFFSLRSRQIGIPSCVRLIRAETVMNFASPITEFDTPLARPNSALWMNLFAAVLGRNEAKGSWLRPSLGSLSLC